MDVVELALRRYAFNVKPLTPEVVADQQRIADTFYALKLIPKAIQVREAVIVPQPCERPPCATPCLTTCCPHRRPGC